jgi:putative ABC transport system permease protein
VAVGDRVEAQLDRRRNDRPERVVFELQLVGVVAEAVLPGTQVLAPLELLVATEDYRDGIAVPQWNWAGNPNPGDERVFARFRLYASSIYDVAPLRNALLAEGIEVHTQAEEIESMQLLDRNLSRVFWLLATLGSAGFLASLAANLLAGVDRKRRELSVLGILGFPTRSLMLFPLTQAALIAGLGGTIAVLAYWLVAALLNAWFAASLRAGELICRLRPLHILFALLATLGCALAASAWAGYRAARIEPARGVRDV